MKKSHLVTIASLLIFSNMVSSPSYSEKNEQNFSIGKVEWSEKCHPLIFNAGLVRVTDLDMNLDPNAFDRFEIKVWSDFDAREDHVGKVVAHTATETGNSTGIFESTVFWGDPWDDSLGSRIPIWDNSTVTALYVDDTLPPPHSKANVTGSLIVKDIEPIYKKLRNGTSVPYYIYDVCTMQFLDTIRYQFAQKIEFIFPSPLEQLASGLAIDEIQCKDRLQLVIKANNGNPVCIKPGNKAKLLERGWAFGSYQDYRMQPKIITDIKNDTGIITWKDRIYYFDTPHYTDDVYSRQVQTSFHDVVFTLFPQPFNGGLPTGGCGGSYYWTNAKFSDGINELLHIFVNSKPCHDNTIPITLSNHANPQAGLTFYDGKMRLLIYAQNQSDVS